METAVATLKRSKMQIGQSYLSFVVAVGFAVCGIWILEVCAFQRSFLVLSLVCVCSSSFTLLEAQRDIGFSELSDHKGRPLPGLHLRSHGPRPFC